MSPETKASSLADLRRARAVAIYDLGHAVLSGDEKRVERETKSVRMIDASIARVEAAPETPPTLVGLAPPRPEDAPPSLGSSRPPAALPHRSRYNVVDALLGRV